MKRTLTKKDMFDEGQDGITKTHIHILKMQGHIEKQEKIASEIQSLNKELEEARDRIYYNCEMIPKRLDKIEQRYLN